MRETSWLKHAYENVSKKQLVKRHEVSREEYEDFKNHKDVYILKEN